MIEPETYQHMRSFLRTQLRGAARLAYAASIVACACTVMSFFGTLGWFLELTTHFRVQYAVWLAAMAFILGVLRKFPSALAFAFFSLVNFSFIAPLFFGRPGPTLTTAPKLKFLQMNVETENQNYEAVRQLIRAEHPDVVELDEVNAKWVQELQELQFGYSYNVVDPRQDNFGIAVFSRVPWSAVKVLSLGDAGVESVTAKLPLGDQTVSVIFTHPLPPGSPEYTRLRNGQLDAIAGWVIRQHPPVMILGDLNMTPFSPYFQKLLDKTGLTDSSRGYGLQTTWPTQFPFLAVAIDHCLLSPGLIAANRRIGPNVGSDHYPLIVTVTSADAVTGK